VVATVVRARRPTSVRPGDGAIVLGDGTIEGFVGGVCAESSVRLHSLRALETGEPLLLRLVPGDAEGEGAPAQLTEGAVVEHNPCLSGGSLEIFLEPHLPAPRLVILGDSPIAQALERVGRAAGYHCCLVGPDGTAAGDAGALDGTAAVVVSSHGNGEETMLAAALRAGVPYVALVASAKRGAAVRAKLEIADELRSRLHTPAGLQIGARSPEEIAISILAELIAQQDAPAPGEPDAEVVVQPSVVEGGTPALVEGGTRALVEATDPVCGMRVAVTAATPQSSVGGETVFFCSVGCRDRHARKHADAVVAP
jgi:xanthine dehydrogenase accessory factor